MSKAIELISDDELKRLREMNNRMTSAPWEFEAIPGQETERLIHVVDDSPELEPEPIDILFGAEAEVEENWAGICRIRNAMPGLLARLDAAESRVAEAAAECAELNATFELQNKADMRAIKLWQEAHPEKSQTWPDRCSMVVWLMERLDAGVSGTLIGFRDGNVLELRVESASVRLGKKYRLIAEPD